MIVDLLEEAISSNMNGRMSAHRFLEEIQEELDNIINNFPTIEEAWESIGLPGCSDSPEDFHTPEDYMRACIDEYVLENCPVYKAVAKEVDMEWDIRNER